MVKVKCVQRIVVLGFRINFSNSQYNITRSYVPYGRLLLAPAEGWWHSATWRALRALWIAVKKIFGPPFFYRGLPLYPPPLPPPLPLAQSFFLLLLFLPPFFYRGPPPIPPPSPPPYSLHRVFLFFFIVAILDFTDVKNMTEWNGGDQARFFMWIS